MSTLSESLPQNLRTSLDALALVRMLGDPDGLKNLSDELGKVTAQATEAYERLAQQKEATDASIDALDKRQYELNEASEKLAGDRRKFVADRDASLAAIVEDEAKIATARKDIAAQIAGLAVNDDRIVQERAALATAEAALTARQDTLNEAEASLKQREATMLQRDTELAAAEAAHARRAAQLRAALA